MSPVWNNMWEAGLREEEEEVADKERRPRSSGSRAKRITEEPAELAGMAGCSYTPPLNSANAGVSMCTHRYRASLKA